MRVRERNNTPLLKVDVLINFYKKEIVEDKRK